MGLCAEHLGQHDDQRHGDDGQQGAQGNETYGKLGILAVDHGEHGAHGGGGRAQGDDAGDEGRGVHVEQQADGQPRQGDDHQALGDGEPGVPVPEDLQDLCVRQVVADDDHGQGRIQCGKIIDRRIDQRRQGRRGEEQDQPHGDAQHAGIGDQPPQGEQPPVVAHHIKTQRPAEDVGHRQKSRAEKHAVRPQQRVFQGQGHKAAVGKDGGEAINALALQILVAQGAAGDAVGKGDNDDGEQQCLEECAGQGRFKGTLKGLDHHAGRDDIQHEIRHARHGGV